MSRSLTFEQDKAIVGTSGTDDWDDVVGTGIEAKPKRKTHHPMGLSTGIVGQNGRLPICAGCNQAIDRGSQHILLRKTVNMAKFWMTTTSFHFKEACITGLREELQKQAKALISPPVLSPYQQSNYSPTKTKKQQSKCRAVLRELSTSLGPAWTSTVSQRTGRNNG